MLSRSLRRVACLGALLVPLCLPLSVFAAVTDDASCVAAGGQCARPGSACPTGSSSLGTCTAVAGFAAPTCCKSGNLAGGTGGSLDAAAQNASSYTNLYCFTQDECSSPRYGGSLDRFHADSTCPPGYGTCLAPEPIVTLQSPVMGQTTVKGFEGYVTLLFTYLLRVVGIAATIMFVFGGFQYIYGSTLGEKAVASAKKKIEDASIGLILVFGSVALLRTLNPATLDLNAVKIFLIKGIDFSQVNECSKLPAKDGKPAMVAPSQAKPEDPPGTLLFSADPAKFTVPAANATCGISYYIQGTAGQTCTGTLCPQSNQLCLQGPAVNGTSVASSCITSTFGGTVSWQDGAFPSSMFLFPVCYWAQPGSDGWTQSSMQDKVLGDVLPAQYIGPKPSGQSGSAAYLFGLTYDQVKKWEGECAGKGGIDGVLMGVTYNDVCSLLGQAGKVAGANGVINTSHAVVDAAACVVSPDDMAIVSQNDCTHIYPSVIPTLARTYFSGYVTSPASNSKWYSVAKWSAAIVMTPFTAGGSLVAATVMGSSDQSLVAKAVYCGMRVTPGGGWTGSDGITHRLDWKGATDPASPYWTFQNMSDATAGGKSIRCDLTLNSVNAPQNPSTALMSGCGDTRDWDPSATPPGPTSNLSSFF